MSQKLDGVELEVSAMSEERAREFDEWVRRRLAGWSTGEIAAFDRWLMDESHFEFVASVRRAWMHRRLAESDLGEPAA
jgi:hypothetical protein